MEWERGQGQRSGFVGPKQDFATNQITRTWIKTHTRVNYKMSEWINNSFFMSKYDLQKSNLKQLKKNG